MKQYVITDYTRNKLDQLNRKLNTDQITIKPAEDLNKKIDIYINGVRTNTIGDNNYLDYPNYILKNGLNFANNRRELYYKRHKNDADIKDGKITNGFFAKYLLW